MNYRKLNPFIARTLLLVAISCPGIAAEKIERKMYNPWEAEIGYSQVVKAGNTLYISGIASDKPTLQEQVEEIYILIRNTLKDNGLGMNSIVKQVIYTTDIEAYKKLGAAGKKHFAENEYPSSTLVQVQRLYGQNHKVEIEVVAYIEKT
jgi:2-iminobutanoate/2-iminopropanoate deaminase